MRFFYYVTGVFIAGEPKSPEDQMMNVMRRH